MTLSQKSKQRILDEALQKMRSGQINDPLFHLVDVWESSVRNEYIRLGYDIPAEVKKDFACIEPDDEGT